MKIKNKQLGLVKYLNTQPLPRKWDAKTLYQHAKLSKEVNAALEVLNKTEMDCAVSVDPDYPVENAFVGKDAHANFIKYEAKIKPVQEEEIELPDVPKFKIGDWPNLELTAEQLLGLIEIGIIEEEEPKK